jgi:hypothetical protein
MVERLKAVALVGIVAGAVAACDIAAGAFAGRATDEWTRQYMLASGSLELVNVNGHIRLTAADGTTVEVHAERTARARSDDAARALLSRLEIREQVGADRVRIETRPPAGGFLSGSTTVAYEVRVPPGIGVRLRTSNGALDARGVQGELKLETVNGGITAQAVGGSVEGRTVNGTIDVAVSRLGSAGLRLETTNGGINVRLPPNAGADVRARVTNGGIDVSGLEVEHVGERTRRRLEGRLHGGGPLISLETTNGGIQIAGGS